MEAEFSEDEKWSDDGTDRNVAPGENKLNEPFPGNSPGEESLMMRPMYKSPTIKTNSDGPPPTISPRSTRRLMLQTELTSS